MCVFFYLFIYFLNSLVRHSEDFAAARLFVEQPVKRRPGSYLNISAEKSKSHLVRLAMSDETHFYFSHVFASSRCSCDTTDL